MSIMVFVEFNSIVRVRSSELDSGVRVMTTTAINSVLNSRDIHGRRRTRPVLKITSQGWI